MGLFDLFSKGTRYLLSGDVRSPAAWAYAKYTDSRIIDVDECETPTWIDVPGATSIAKNYRSDHSEYYPTLSESCLGERIRIAPEVPFDRINTTIVDVEDAGRVSIEVDYETESGSTDAVEFSFTNGPFNEFRCIPVTIPLPEPALSADLRYSTDRSEGRLPRALRDSDVDWKITRTPRLSVPSPKPSGDDGIPIVVISVDTFRYDYMDAFEPVIDALGPDAVVPSEPRTQGHWTRPSHASTFTGVHPADHGYVVGASDGIDVPTIDPDLTTIAEYLTDRLYRCSGVASQSSLSGDYGFARGFQRYELRNMTWEEREHDARSIVDRAIGWLETDAEVHSDRLFYFLHLYDPHYPNLPPYPVVDELDLDLPVLSRFMDWQPRDDYVEILNGPAPDVPEDDLELVLGLYRKSLRYTAEQVCRFIETMKRRGLFEDALIFVLGDHGEEFYERKFVGHETLYDENIRPGVIVKPPAGAGLTVPDDVDFIDVFPTVATLLGERPPEQCQGIPWETRPANDRPRITERLRPDWYNVSVEIDGKKGIFTYPENFPLLPSNDAVSGGPVEEEFVDLETWRSSEEDPGDETVTDETRHGLRERASEFASRETTGEAKAASVQPSSEVRERLRKLGYR